jgi:hypothetical protein
LTSGKITITTVGQEVRYSTLSEIVYGVKLDDKENGFLWERSWEYLRTEQAHKAILAEKAECDRRGGVRVGMTKAEVLASCWGKPKSINSTTTARGTSQQWVYGRSYLYFDENGLLTTIQN